MKRFLILLSVISVLAGACKKVPSPGTWTKEDELKAEQFDAAAMLFSELLCRNVTPEELIELKDKKIEPEIGRVTDDSNPFDRAVKIDEKESAEFYFGGLVGWNPAVFEETAGGSIIDLTPIGLGRLEFFREPDGSNVGYATVDIPCMPHLERITYKTPLQMGLNDAEYPSPARYGEVFLHQGRYYICVRAGTGYLSDESGLLVCIEPGKGTNWVDYLDNEDWGCWKPRQNWYDVAFISRYLTLCTDSKFRQDKAQIVRKFPGKIFPKLQRWHNYDSQEYVGDLTWGFGTLEAGYYHVTHFNADIAKEKSAGVKVVIARDATEGDYKASAARWYRRFHFYTLPSVCTTKTQLSAQTYKYTGKGGWEDFFEDDYNSPIIYTMNAVRFYETLPDGYQRVNIWDDSEVGDGNQDPDGFYRAGSESELNNYISINTTVKVRLTDNIKLSSSLIINGPKTATIDLNGHTLNRGLGSMVSGVGQVIGVRSGAVLNMSNGYITGGWGGDGGGIFNVGTVNLTNVSIYANNGNDRGGGIANHGTLTMKDCTVSENTSFDSMDLTGGGGIFNYEGATATLTNVVFSDNDNRKYGGAGLVNMGTATLIDCTFIDNSCPTNGGGIWNSGTLSIEGGSIRNNSVSSGVGGGILNKGKLSLKGSPVIAGNVPDNLFLDSGKLITVSGALTQNADISVTLASGTGVFTSGYSSFCASISPADIFRSDNSKYSVSLSGGEASLK
ncbi:MAG: right-handed parallel beta-helix repeat-containing protein [Bacteroidales bacterium]|nr:right-handed parallel beta-helix repeat-containing protein [Bacteroidales bacterium]